MKKQSKPKPKPAVKEWEDWPRFLEALNGKVSMAVLTNLQLSGKGLLNDAALTILCDDEVTQMLAKNASAALEACAAEITGHPTKVKVRFAEKQPENNGAFDEIIERAHKLDIKVTEF